MVNDPNYVPFGPQMETASPDFSLAQMEPSFGEYFTAQAGEVLRDSPLSSMYRLNELYGSDINQMIFDTPKVSSEDAQAEANNAGVKLDFGKGASYPRDTVNIMIDRARRRQDREETIATRQPYGITQLGVSLLAGLADPFNVGLGFIPIVGEANYAAMLARAGGFASRSAIRAGVGAAEGAFGAAVAEPFLGLARTQEGQDFTVGMVLQDFIFSAGLGIGSHVAMGAVAEKVFGRTYVNAPPGTPADIIDRLPPDIRQAALRAAISDLVEGRSVQAQEVIDYATSQDPELARSITYAQTLKRDGPPIDDTEARVAFWEGKLAGQKKAAGKPQDFIAWVRSLGGVRDIDGALEAYLGKGHGMPSSVFITQRGAKRTQRGVNFEDLYYQAVQEGFVNTKQEFIDAFRGHAGGVLAPVVRRADSDNALRVKEEQDYIKSAIEASGINPNAANKFKARAIAAREMHVLTAERARISAALAALEARKQDMIKGDQPQPTPKTEEQPKPKVPEAKTEEKQAPEVGDMVNIVSGKERIISNEKPAKVRQIMNDPKYGAYAFIEGSNTGIPLKDLELVEKGKPAETPSTLEKAVEQDKTDVAKAAQEEAKLLAEENAPPPETGEVNAGMVRKAIRQAMEENGERPINSEDVRKQFPGLGKKKFAALLKEATSSETSGLQVRKGEGNITEIHRVKLSATQKELASMESYDRGIAAFRRDMDAKYPSMAKEGLYYLDSLMSRRTDYGIGEAKLVEWLNRKIKDGKLEVLNEETGKPLDRVGTEYLDPDTELPALILKFKTAVRPEPLKAPTQSLKKGKQPKLGALTPEELEAVKADEAAKKLARTKPIPTPESPPAEKTALNTEELAKFTAQTEAIEAATLKKLDALLAMLPEDTAATLRAELTRVERDGKAYEALLESATQCLLKP